MRIYIDQFQFGDTRRYPLLIGSHYRQYNAGLRISIEETYLAKLGFGS